MIKIYNTLTRTKEEIKPIEKNTVKIYSCGPTVYDSVHIGNIRTFFLNDILVRTLKLAEFSVKHAMNITDVDDKIIKKSRSENIPIKEITAKYENIFWNDLKDININKPDIILHATDSIPEMIDIIKILLDKGFAYNSPSGVYFRVGKYAEYNTLRKHGDFDDVSDNDTDIKEKEDKENAHDFALWKKSDDEPFWEAPFGKGRPGWHIECSAMSRKALGQPFDIHTGGVDLIFPHHTNEIAQSVCAYDEEFAHYWIHGAFLNISDTKMSKSLGNFKDLNFIKSIVKNPLALRYLYLTSHYRTIMNFSDESLLSAEKSLNSLYSKIARVKSSVLIENANDMKDDAKFDEYNSSISNALFDDLNTPRALGILHEMLESKDLLGTRKIKLVEKFDRVFGLNLIEQSNNFNSSEEFINIKDLPENIQEILQKRKTAREEKKWKESDLLRDELKKEGYQVIDDGEEMRVKTISTR